MKLQEILKIKKKGWFAIGAKIKGWILKDAVAGISQGRQTHYVNGPYKEYKKRGMKRKRNSSKLLASMEGVSPISTKTKNVNMLLTGKTIRGLKPVKSTTKSVTMSYPNNKRTEDLIEGNEALGTNIRTLTPKNQRNVKKEIEYYLDKNIKEYCKKPIIIKA